MRNPSFGWSINSPAATHTSQQGHNLHTSLMHLHLAARSSQPTFGPALHTSSCGDPRYGGEAHLLSRMASSTCVLFSEAGAPREVWLMADRNFSSSLVLSVFPAPLSPLLRKRHMFHSQLQDRLS